MYYCVGPDQSSPHSKVLRHDPEFWHQLRGGFWSRGMALYAHGRGSQILALAPQLLNRDSGAMFWSRNFGTSSKHRLNKRREARSRILGEAQALIPDSVRSTGLDYEFRRNTACDTRFRGPWTRSLREAQAWIPDSVRSTRLDSGF
jgi:hypothetical protein